VLLRVRVTMGPTMLDRTVALDVLIAVGICAVALEAAVNRHTSTLPLLLVLTLLGFVGSVSIARFTRGSDVIEPGRNGGGNDESGQLGASHTEPPPDQSGPTESAPPPSARDHASPSARSPEEPS
jgi:multicomponent Na+:H+ antiporter subunit F